MGKFWSHTKESIKKIKKVISNRTEEEKKIIYNKISLSKKGKPSPTLGYKWTKEQRENLSKKRMGYKPKQKSIDKMVASKKGFKHSIETRKKMRGKIPWNYKGGVENLYKKIRNLAEYKKWRIFSHIRSNHRCCCCDKKESKKNKLFIHHKNKSFFQIIKDNNIKNIDEAINCKELWNVNNGQAVCEKCHKKIHFKRKPNFKKN